MKPLLLLAALALMSRRPTPDLRRPQFAPIEAVSRAIRTAPSGNGTLAGGVRGGVFDAGELLVETFDGHDYRSHSCNAPTSGSAVRPVDSKALATCQLLAELRRSIRESK